MRPGEILVDRLESIEDTKVELNLSVNHSHSSLFSSSLSLSQGSTELEDVERHHSPKQVVANSADFE